MDFLYKPSFILEFNVSFISLRNIKHESFQEGVQKVAFSIQEIGVFFPFLSVKGINKTFKGPHRSVRASSSIPRLYLLMILSVKGSN